jgi:hypothetical protein
MGRRRGQAGRRRCRRCGSSSGALLYLGNEAIAASGYRGYEPVFARFLAQRLAQGINGLREIALFHDDHWPERPHQVGFGDQLPMLLQQQAQGLKRPTGQMYRSAVVGVTQLILQWIELEACEGVDAW